MKIKTAELEGAALDWVVAQCLGVVYLSESGIDGIGIEYSAADYSINWMLSGPIIDNEGIGLMPPRLRIAPNGQQLGTKDDGWFATVYTECDDGQSLPSISSFGPTPLIAALRCFVTRNWGDVVDVPEELAA